MNIIEKFNLPKYVKGKSFAEASACIAKKFKDKNSPEDLATLNDLQGRLRQAQEFVKAEKEKRSKPQNHVMPDGTVMPGATHEDSAQAFASRGNNRGVESSLSEQTNEYALGGLLGALGGGAGAAGAGGALGGGGAGGLLSKLLGGGAGAEGVGVPGAKGYMKAAAGAIDMANTAFGKPNIDTSGATAPPDVPSEGASAAMGAIKGMQAGKAFGPWGMAAGTVLGGVSGLIGGKKAKDAAVEAEWQHTSGHHNKATNNYKTGGSLLANMLLTGGDTDTDPAKKIISDGEATLAEMKKGIAKANQMTFDRMGLSDDNLDMMELENEVTDIQNFTQGYTPGQSFVNEASAITSNFDKKENEEEDKFNPAELLRYAPAAMNLGQLMSLKKPEEIGLDRLGNKYDKQLVDEKGLQNVVQGSTANTRDAILGATGGSGSAARANLLASQLQGTKALSSAYQQATEANRQENRAAQQFNLGVDQANLGQSNQEKNLNLEQQAAYESNKSKLLAQLGQDLGGIGTEELFKRYPELMGLSYDWRGTHSSKKKKKKSKNN